MFDEINWFKIFLMFVGTIIIILVFNIFDAGFPLIKLYNIFYEGTKQIFK